MDFPTYLWEQLDFVRVSCEQFDNGRPHEAKRIATALRVMFRQTDKSTSLLTHLRATDIKMLSTCDKPGPNQKFFPAMTNIVLNPAEKLFAYVPKLSVPHERPVPFNERWFSETVYLTQPNDLKITRKDLVLGAADKDGGAHVDAILEPKYEAVLGGLGFLMTVMPDGQPKEDIPCRNGHLSALRQIGYEVLHSPELLNLAGCTNES